MHRKVFRQQQTQLQLVVCLTCAKHMLVASVQLLFRLTAAPVAAVLRSGLAGDALQEQAQHHHQHGGGHRSSLVLEQK
jgi:hypothetical protein